LFVTQIAGLVHWSNPIAVVVEVIVGS